MLPALVVTATTIIGSFIGAYIMDKLEGVFTKKFGKFVGIVLPGAIAFSLVVPVGVYLVKLVG